MAASPDWKVYLGAEYRASCKYVEDAACLVALLGDGATIRFGHRQAYWTEGSEDRPASESYDHVRDTVLSRFHRNAAKVARDRQEAALQWKAQLQPLPGRRG